MDCCAVVFGFQLAALVWRLNRELRMAERRERTWLTSADYMVYGFVLILVVGVFIAPILDIANFQVTVWLFGLSIIVFALSPVVLAGHYNLYRYRKGRRPNFTFQEGGAWLIAALVVSAYFIGSSLILSL